MPANENENNDVSKQKKKPSIVLKLLIFFILSALIAIGAVFGYVKFSQNKDIVVESIYTIPLDTYNLKSGGASSFAQVSMSLAYTDESILKALEKDLPVIKDAIIMTLSDIISDDLATSEQKDELKKVLIKKFNDIILKYNGNIKEPVIINLYFDKFMIN